MPLGVAVSRITMPPSTGVTEWCHEYENDVESIPRHTEDLPPSPFHHWIWSTNQTIFGQWWSRGGIWWSCIVGVTWKWPISADKCRYSVGVPKKLDLNILKLYEYIQLRNILWQRSSCTTASVIVLSTGLILRKTLCTACHLIGQMFYCKMDHQPCAASETDMTL